MPDNQSSESQPVATLRRLAAECRLEIIQMIERAASGHPGGSFSIIDILVTLFFHEMKMDPNNSQWEDRDRLVLSKGHGVPALYSVLAKKGAIRQEELMTLRRLNSRLQGHPDRVRLPFVEASTGSLGQGLSIAQGMALALKLEKRACRVFCILGDGESQEGQIWEAAMSIPKFRLNNLVAILDNNNGQIDGSVQDVMEIRPIADKWRAFRWEVLEVDGHDFQQLIAALAKTREQTERPTLILAHTIKGKGVSFMENNMQWHGTAPNKEELGRAMAELRQELKP